MEEDLVGMGENLYLKLVKRSWSNSFVSWRQNKSYIW